MSTLVTMSRLLRKVFEIDGTKISRTEKSILFTRGADFVDCFEVSRPEGTSELIISPGKFEGEQSYMPIMYEVFMNGMANDDGRVLSVKVDAADRAAFPALRGRRSVSFVIGSDGFVTEKF